MSKPTIKGAFALGGRVFVAGEEDQLAAAAKAAKFDLAGAAKEGSPLSGDWASKAATRTTATGEAYPADFPSRKELEAAGVKSAADAQAMDRDALIKLDGIGPAKADAILAFKA